MFKSWLFILVSIALAGCGGSTDPDSEQKTDTQPASPQATLASTELGGECVDPDGDGWGWNENGSCFIGATAPADDILNNAEGPVEPNNCEKIASGNFHITELVTDVFLTAGQSNATGDSTSYEPDNYQKDQPNFRLIAWTDKNSWEVADPETQTWHSGLYPSGRDKTNNHPAFQIGRAIANADDCRVVAFIATGASGQPINYWRHNDDNHYQDINSTVTAALNALPGRHSVDMIWWMQGEADNDQNIDRYFFKLSDLIDTFRSEAWFDSDGYFLANETGWFEFANQAIRLLRSDDDGYTDYSRGEDSFADRFPNLPADGEVRTHFDSVSLRKIGDLVADKYLEEYLPSVNTEN